MTREEWENWRVHPQTKEFFRVLARAQEHFKDQWAAGAYLSDDPQATQNLNQKMFGRMDTLDEVAKVDYEAFKSWIYSDKEIYEDD